MEIKDSNNRREFETGAVRDANDEKGRCDLMPLVEIHNLMHRVRCPYQGKEAVLIHLNTFIRESLASPLINDGLEDSLYNALNNFIDNHYKSMSECLLDLSVHYKNGAKKYKERNWEAGIPIHSFIDSAVRHYIKYMDGWNDENHKAAFVWNIIGALYTLRVLPELNDIGDTHA